MPAHVAGQLQPGSEEAAKGDARRGWPRSPPATARISSTSKIASRITTEDANYWDTLHYRLPIAERIVEGIARAVATGKDDPGGDWRYLAGPPR